LYGTNGLGCDDGNECTFGEACNAGICVSGTTLRTGLPCDNGVSNACIPAILATPPLLLFALDPTLPMAQLETMGMLVQ